MERPVELLTVGRVAKMLGVSVERVNRLIRERGIEPAARAGTLRVFDLEAVERLRDALAERQQGANQ